MIKAETKTMIDFQPIALQNKTFYESLLPDGNERGCDFTFANLYLWGRQNIAVIHEHIVLFSKFGNRSVYPYPIGTGDKKPVLDAIIADAKARGIPCQITGLSSTAMQTLETLYPGKFRFHCDEGLFDYVYAIDDLADLKGKKYHNKRNHLNRFNDAYPEYTTEPLGKHNVSKAIQMVSDWYKARLEKEPDGDYHMEQEAIKKAFSHFSELDMEGLLLLNGDEVLAVTLGSRMCDDTFDVHFEKARPDANGAYTAINYEFARYIRNKYPSIKYIDREEDMGLEGLRQSKRSYYPHHMIKRCSAEFLGGSE